jgi:hypothetical protein
MQGAWSGCFQGYRGEAMHYLGYDLRRILIPRTLVNKGKSKGWALGKPTSNSGKEKELLTEGRDPPHHYPSEQR